MSGSSLWAALGRSLSPAYPTTNAVRNDNSLVHLKACRNSEMTAIALSVVLDGIGVLFSEVVPREAPSHRECRAREDPARPSRLGRPPHSRTGLVLRRDSSRPTTSDRADRFIVASRAWPVGRRA